MGEDGYGVNIRTEPEEDEEDGEHSFWIFYAYRCRDFISIFLGGEGEGWMNKYLEA